MPSILVCSRMSKGKKRQVSVRIMSWSLFTGDADEFGGVSVLGDAQVGVDEKLDAKGKLIYESEKSTGLVIIHIERFLLGIFDVL